MSGVARPIALPAPHDDDFEDVHWALTAANSLWEGGEDEEALKWLRRAANTASERGADLRAVELFKAAADVASAIEQRDLDTPTERIEPLGDASKVLPEPPPEPELSESMGDLEGASEREVMLRKALMAMDAPPPPAAPRRRAPDDGAVAKRARKEGRLPTLRVAILPIPDEGELRLLFLPPGEQAPPGVATALLVPPTPEDAELLAALYDDSDAKM